MCGMLLRTTFVWLQNHWNPAEKDTRTPKNAQYFHKKSRHTKPWPDVGRMVVRRRPRTGSTVAKAIRAPWKMERSVVAYRPVVILMLTKSVLFATSCFARPTTEAINKPEAGSVATYPPPRRSCTLFWTIRQCKDACWIKGKHLQRPLRRRRPGSISVHNSSGDSRWHQRRVWVVWGLAKTRKCPTFLLRTWSTEEKPCPRRTSTKSRTNADSSDETPTFPKPRKTWSVSCQRGRQNEGTPIRIFSRRLLTSKLPHT